MDFLNGNVHCDDFCSQDGEDKKRPVIIHRAILGSVERMIAILTENYGGKWFVNVISQDAVVCLLLTICTSDAFEPVWLYMAAQAR